MKNKSLSLLMAGLMCLQLFIPVYGQSPTPPSLIVRSDDMGAFHSVNLACVEAMEHGIQTTIEVMPVAAWFPEAARMLKENPQTDVGIHLALTSEWDLVKWRPLTPCPSLTDENGYFYPALYPNESRPGIALMEQDWKVEEIEQEFRAQIELGLKMVPQCSRITSHMGCTRFAPEVQAVALRLAEEYNLSYLETDELRKRHNVTFVGYNGAHRTAAEKEESFVRMLATLQPGQSYMFLDHPALDDREMESVEHPGYEDVAQDRQGVTDLLCNAKVKAEIEKRGIRLTNYNELTKSLPRSTAEAEGVPAEGLKTYLDAVENSGQEMHSLMIVRHGKVIAEQWWGDHSPTRPHIMNSVSKTFTATAIGFAVAEGRLKVTDKVISFFPDKLPTGELPAYLDELEVKHLLTMSVGQDEHTIDPIRRTEGSDWVAGFLAHPIVHQPGTQFGYNSLGSYILSAILSRVTGEDMIDYLYPRLFRPLGIVGVTTQRSPQGIPTGGWGMYLKTEDMAKMGQFFLQRGQWDGKQLLPESWFDEATAAQIESLPPFQRKEDLKVTPLESDALYGYGYQMWRCRHNALRADGANGQYILILPDQDTVVVTTAHVPDMQKILDLIWEYLYPVL